MPIYSENECRVCNAIFKSFKSLSNHISMAHGIPAKEYYDNYIALEDENLCKNSCVSESVFISVSKGYKPYCKKCSRSIGAKGFRKELKADKKRFEQFSNKVSKNQISIWQERVETGEAEEIRKRIGETNKITISNMTKEERSERFGWLNKVKISERDETIARIIFPAINFWKNGDPYDIKRAREKRSRTMLLKSPEEKQEISKKRLATRYNMTMDCIERWYSDKSSKELYYNAVWEYTEISYNYNKHIIDPHNLRGLTNGTGYHLDHVYSIMQGFVYSIDPKIIGHACNLQMLSSVDNLAKSAECWITLDELDRKIYRFDINNKNNWVAEVINGIQWKFPS